MDHIPNTTARPYRSQLRAEQAQETRERILDATGRVMAAGIATVSIPAVAHEAGVSIPTVYRNFRTKRDLLESLYPHAVRRARLGELTPPTSLEDLRGGMLSLFNRIESFDDLARAAMASPASEEIRHLNMPERVALTRQFADTIAPGLSTSDRDRIARLLVILSASASLRMWRDHLGVSVEEAADDVDWIMRSVVAGAPSVKSG
jgi:AcrR family transcriptional regulator